MHLNIEYNLTDVIGSLTGAIERAGAPLAGASGEAAIGIIRFGDGSVEEQFDRGVEYYQGGIRPWDENHPFGGRELSNPPLAGGGHLRGAWLGGNGSFITVTDNSVELGVDESIPYAKVFQSDTPITIKPHSTTKAGSYVMQIRLAQFFGVLLTRARLEQGIVIAPRRLGIGDVATSRLERMLTMYILENRIEGA